ncbi:hypothetical protein BC940DRAFT_94337 [Gongronella butleri]|nr:hypothetical protein BC940DRAFT_94337 [Gongronella butleri]
MFLQSDGNFTTNHVLLTEGMATCVVVLLGPSPATNVIRPENHLGPTDSVMLQAVGNTTIISIELQQHRRQPNAYFASVHFAQADQYILRGSVEFRSYFWEQPIYHWYKPVAFNSVNMAMVKSLYKLPQDACDARNPDHWQGAWMNKTTFQTAYPLDFYGMFGPIQEDHAEFDRLFVPDNCRFDYISYGQAAQCLRDQVIHVWDDGNIRRNLKSFESANRWCKDNKTAECWCNDENDDIKGFPWLQDSTTPLTINKTWHANTRIFYHDLQSITVSSYKPAMQKQIAAVAPASHVLLGVGNYDAALNRIDPKEFAYAFDAMVTYLAEKVYPHQTIVVRTPQYFCCGQVPSTSWNLGRNAAFARVVRHVVEQAQAKHGSHRILLWDVYRLGIEENTCVSQGAAYSRKNVVNVENIMLWNLLCRHRSS